MKEYDHRKIEKKWQEEWENSGIYKADNNSSKTKMYVLDMFPYPSGEGLHVGHPKGYIATDIYSRYKKMNGFNVLHPMGWDAFGLPAENFAIKNKTHPKISTNKNIKRYKEQLYKIGFNYDWKKEINTTDPDYYRWTQWIFLKLYEKGLAYESYEPINWCPSCQTGLANEDLDGDRCERCDSLVEKKPMRQWVLKITDYADRLLEGLEGLDWPESIKESQKNWIGKSEGAEITFVISNQQQEIKVFTTRADTLFGATYLVLAPEHKLLDELKNKIKNWDEVVKYRNGVIQRTEIERTAEGQEKTGVKLEGLTAINPANQEEIPIFIADYVLVHYGTGAIMAVPAHDERDFDFAEKFGIKIKQTIAEKDISSDLQDDIYRDAVYGIILNKDRDILIQYNSVHGDYRLIGGGIDKNETKIGALKREIAEESGYKNIEIKEELNTVYHKKFNINISRDVRGLKNVFLVELIDDEKINEVWEDDENLIHQWLSTEDLKKHFHEHKYRTGDRIIIKNYLENNLVFSESGILINSGKFSGMESKEAQKSIIESVGGKITTVYKLKDWVFSRQRYWGEPIPIIHCQKCGVVPVPEDQLPVELPQVDSYEPSGTGESPLVKIDEWVNVDCPKCKGPAKRETNTMPQWAGSSWYYLRYIDNKNNQELVNKNKDKYWSPVDLYVGGAEHATRHLIYARFWHKFLFDMGVVNYGEPFKKLQHVGLINAEDGKKMSKRWGNVINPDEVIENVGADTLRIYEMFMGPFDQAIAWSTNNMVGSRRFLERVWKLQYKLEEEKNNEKLEILTHKTIKKVSEDIEELKFNTAISQMMILVNEFEKSNKVSKELYLNFLKILTPFAPHLTEEIWSLLDYKKFIYLEKWPQYNEEKIQDKNIVIAIQVNGKVRDELEILQNKNEEEIKKLALAQPLIKKWIADKNIKKIIYIQGKIINIVV